MLTSLLQGRMGVCPLLLLLGLALGATVQDHVPITSPPNISARATGPPAAPSLNSTVAQPPPGPTTTLDPTISPVTTTTTTAKTTPSPAGEEDAQPAGRNATVRLLPVPAPSPPAAGEAPQEPASSEPPSPPTPTGVDNSNNDTTGVPTDAPTPDSFLTDLFTVDAHTTTEPGAGFTSDSSPHDNDQSDDTPVIAVMVALSSLLVIIFIIIILYMLRFKKYKQAGSHSNSFRLTNGRSDDTELQSVPLLARSPSTNRKYPPLHVDKLEEEMNRRMADDNKLFREEFNALPVCPIQASCDAASKEENKEKNRYVNILPYDHSRVHLSSLEGVPDSDFVNASFINGYQEKNKFIAAQGPKEETVNDFWRMIWEQNTATIVMVTNLKERKESPALFQCKCAQYWPDQGCWTYGNIRVSVEDTMVLVDYTIRKFCIQQVGDVSGKKPQRLVTQFHFTSWPDFGVPFTPIGMLKFLKKVKNYNPQYAGAIVVHCSAGVGRTGTFIVIDAMLDMMNSERKVDVFGFVTRIRAQRCQMVQTDMQYVFIFQALLEHYLYGDTELEVTSLESHLAKLYSPSPGAGCNGLEAEFKKLTSIKIQNDKMRTGNLPANMKKNRVLQIIPYEFNRVIIPVKRGEENTDYVNASFIDGYRQKDSYMASQGPLQHTIEDYWRMIWEWRSCSIVMLTELEERGQEKCAQYWPSDGVVVHGDISIEIKREEESESYTVRDLLVTNNRENKARAVRQFHFHGWPEVGIPTDGKGMINIIAAVQKQQQQSGNHPITVHCSAGAGRTGTFCALSTVLERVKAEGILDVFQTVKSLRLQRPHMVQTLEQYEFCYKVVQEYIDAFSDYANFK
uniref:receptor-type tyrosine-protein phosphatase alpha isoform X1 n=1 Tax=Gasterosteus aculeatus aculeatus TaxID=481459 RepID=UPI001A97FF70|nr:receptor-type tyrosine-protein phosphatase alpha isoform X1 [Gasterosteus aculeatus aculeatus]XP_040058862.1 receptor-type tyrosine-protein phosphatase alpha isoform X1 [Gasterosteus aculeatus aculeatus]XP_040058863.1 receptor-type tyrosine-protein phosphatase alpha isoform X1 [Gasterosteus aculeatus aculeatus]